ncbi:DUF401 family protein [Selenihalanaerobacter shriftii]|uniref:DUF401 family protein n=1 Tax=Selenihalanaerobacter shriftii TaxID=142842 RepID=A0A1T4JQC5_9FIRM|nr:DUF401 family protein [Selenihalanaerobacter shriftii]SJZ32376.1 hypothetical protein SAMN02745118_00317 [Selenihalanaerobacter shriftii]
MELVGVLLGFVAILILNSRKVNMGLSLIIGSIVAGLFSGMSIKMIGITIFDSVVEPVALQLIIVVTVVSGLGYILKETGDLNNMIDALISLVKDGKILSMLLPALIGTLAVPGGAILSAPMVNESGDRIDLDKGRKTAINLFFRHILLFVYPLYGALILTADMFSVEKIFIIKYNALVMLGGVVAAYFAFFNSSHQENEENKEGRNNTMQDLSTFLISFLPILTIIILAIVFKVPFYLATIAGVLIAVSKNMPDGNFVKEYSKRLKDFLVKGVNYKMPVLIIGVMAFKAVVEGSGAVNGVADFLTSTGLPLSLMITVLGLITGYLTGMTMAAMGILIPIFMPVMPPEAIGAYITLLFTTAFVGYLISPIHLCLALTKEYFESRFKSVYLLTAIPGAVMIIIALIQVMVS